MVTGMDHAKEVYEHDGETPSVACESCGGSGHRCETCLSTGLQAVANLQLREARAVKAAA
jgi:hypothetical protein